MSTTLATNVSDSCLWTRLRHECNLCTASTDGGVTRASDQRAHSAGKGPKSRWVTKSIRPSTAVKRVSIRHARAAGNHAPARAKDRARTWMRGRSGFVRFARPDLRSSIAQRREAPLESFYCGRRRRPFLVAAVACASCCLGSPKRLLVLHRYGEPRALTRFSGCGISRRS